MQERLALGWGRRWRDTEEERMALVGPYNGELSVAELLISISPGIHGVSPAFAITTENINLWLKPKTKSPRCLSPCTPTCHLPPRAKP